MTTRGGPKIVLLGMMTKMPVAGVVWQTVHYLVGFRLLGYDVYYVEAHARTPSMLMADAEDDGSRLAVDYIARVMRRFGFEDRWAYQALHADGRCYGMSRGALRTLYGDAALIINLHGGTMPRPEHAATGRLVYLGTDPVQTEVELAHGRQSTIEFLEPHCAFFTFGENYGNADCGVPVSERFPFKPTRQPVILAFWKNRAGSGNGRFTTVASWKQPWREVRYGGELYRWSKHHEFHKYLDLPRRSTESFELALGACDGRDRALLEANGWRVRDALEISREPDPYRRYILASGGEFTVAKDQNVRLRSGWFSDRSATYLAAGRPVITQDTGFGNVLPTGRGLFAFSNMDEILGALDRIRSDDRGHRRGALAVARECFDHRVVLGRLLEEVGLAVHPARALPAARPEVESGDPSEGRDAQALPAGLVLEPVSRRPLRLPEETVRAVLHRPLPRAGSPSTGGARAREDGSRRRPDASVVIVTCDRLPLTRMCLESVLTNTRGGRLEIIVVDNGSTDGTTDYLLSLSRACPKVRLQLNGSNLGFAKANNIGLSMARGPVLVLLNNDTIVPSGWLRRLRFHLEGPVVGAVGPVTNRACNEAQIDTAYRTYGEFLSVAARRAARRAGEAFEVRRLAMFCFALRRDVWRRVGPLDESFGLGTFEDDDYSLRLREAGWQLACAEDVLIHHFGMASFGDLVPGGRYRELLRANRERFETKWGRPWRPHERRSGGAYADLVARVRRLAERRVPEGARVLVVSRGDAELLRFRGRPASHFPQDEGGGYAGHYPADSEEAISHLETLRDRGAQFLIFPRSALWWLDHYRGFHKHLENRYAVSNVERNTAVIVDLRGARSNGSSGSGERASGVRSGEVGSARVAAADVERGARRDGGAHA